MKDASSKFYHNLSIQALSRSNYKVILDFTYTSELLNSINSKLQKANFYNKKRKKSKTKNEILSKSTGPFDKNILNS